MIIWSGKGILSALVLIVSFFICGNIFPDAYTDYGIILSLFISGLFSWVYGVKWNQQNGEILIDPKTGEQSLVKPNHSLFWIPMQYWGLILPVLGILILAQNSIWLTVVCTLGLLAFVGTKFLPNLKAAATPTSPKKVAHHEKAQPITPVPEEPQETEAERLKRRQEKEDPSRFMPK